MDRIIRIIRYSNSWDRIVLFVFGIRSICDFRIIFEYPNSCHRILNSSRIFYKKDMCRKHSKNLSCRYENKGSNFPHLIWSQNSHIKFFGGLLFDFKYLVFEQLRPNSAIRYSVFVHIRKPNNLVFGIRKIFKNRIIRYLVFGPYSLFGPTLLLNLLRKRV